MPADSGNAELDALIEHANSLVAGAADMGRIQTTLAALGSIVNHTAGIPGRKNLVWLTGNVPFSIGAAAKIFNDANVAVYPIDARGLVGLPAGLTAGARSPRSPGGSRNIPSFGPAGIATMQQIADATGGHAFYDRNDLGNAISMAIEDSALTYTLGFYPDPGALDGKFHELTVRVKRPGLNVRFRRGYYATKANRSSEQDTRSNLQTALWSPLESSTIPLRVVLERANQPKPNCLKVRCIVDVRGLQLSQKGELREGSIEVYIVQQDEAGKTLDGSHDAYPLRLTLDRYASYLKFGLGLSGVIEPRDGLTTIRVVVVDPANGAVGSLIIPRSLVR